ncbi:hypothetical protein HDU76_005277, partial [Blyttiomyces sp. JEL0837]
MAGGDNIINPSATGGGGSGHLHHTPHPFMAPGGGVNPAAAGLINPMNNMPPSTPTPSSATNAAQQAFMMSVVQRAQALRLVGATEENNTEYAQLQGILRQYNGLQAMQGMMGGTPVSAQMMAAGFGAGGNPVGAGMMMNPNNNNAMMGSGGGVPPGAGGFGMQNLQQQQQQQQQMNQMPSINTTSLPMLAPLPAGPGGTSSSSTSSAPPTPANPIAPSTSSGSLPMAMTVTPTPAPPPPVRPAPVPISPATLAAVTPSPAGVLPLFTDRQREALRYQIFAYRQLIQNQPLSEEFRRAVTQSYYSEVDGVAIGPSHSQVVLQHYVDSVGAQKIESQLARDNGFMVSGIDPIALVKERERKIKAHIENRIRVLQSLPSNLTNEPVLRDWKDDGEETFGAPKLRALIELKSLKLLERQKRLREEVLQSMQTSTTLLTSVDRAQYRRVKKQSLREARQTEQIEQSQRSERERREKQRLTDYLNRIVNHGREMTAFHRNQQSKHQKMGAAVLKFHSYAEKEEQKRAQRMAQERLNALKANDEEAYLKLIDQAKDTRITHILSKTSQYLANLSAAVLTQKESVAGSDMLVEEEAGSNMVLDDGVEESNRDYYQIAHRIQEEVTEQASILVGGRLKEYQIKGLQWMISLYNNRLNGILADEMGLGKTIQTISLVTYLIERKKQNGPFLIIIPLATMTNWVMEFDKWAPSVSKIVFQGPPLERKRLAGLIKQGNFNVLITTYEYIIKERPLLSKIKWVHMIIDEGHRMKNAESKLSTTLMQYYQTRYRLILTGTPLQNNLPELWALLNFILPKIFNSVKSFDEWFSSPFSQNSVGQNVELTEEEKLLMIKGLHKVLRPFLLRRLKKDVESELPDKVETVIKCPMSALQRKITDWVKARRVIGPFDQTKLASGTRALNNLMMQFRKICNHPFIFPEVEELVCGENHSLSDIIYRCSGKFELLDRILPKFFKTGHRIL